MNSEIRLFYVTCPSQDVARKISSKLLNEGLVACANILPGMESIYWWEGKIETSQEVVLILKATDVQSSRIIARVESLHPYNTPCILSLPVEKGSEAYVRWLKGSLF
ncbi:divalent-cation tolerance protein CutA [Bdellovibrio sp. HCB337]|uniref:divalent-cation tolerance protein CutA n=1 Tax=Bdellovibrio sp. HCB337 TaxID=3394358 RepID=UPI0039A457DF